MMKKRIQQRRRKEIQESIVGQATNPLFYIQMRNLKGRRSNICMLEMSTTDSFCFQSSTVSYGGSNGTYYTSSRTRRTGSDGVTFEESKEADSSTRESSYTISRGIRGKGHSLSRKLNSDGKVDTMQTLRNINEDELTGSEEEWKGKGQKYMPGWSGSIEAGRNNGQAELARQGGWALLSTEYTHPVGTTSEVSDKVGSSHAQERPRIDSSGRSAYHPGGRSRN
ncbi:uncharacterized protein LOC113849327 [Abrus precatorius]|uniref:Uncharacterized protein LOC113849327 n=1 Tax=Abrus precatorius TaxID=3816 RepID=A0A8B8JWF4_ABRPR|nr:uncharacterized protein LOC113849327 [Abrus precatorius]XP_027334969.1 uncharacterized protein LOC113849327 [Abrus precatorius]